MNAYQRNLISSIVRSIRKNRTSARKFDQKHVEWFVVAIAFGSEIVYTAKIGYVTPSDQDLAYMKLKAHNKLQVLFDNPSFITSSQGRDPDRKIYGGAVRCLQSGVSVSVAAFSENMDTAMSSVALLENVMSFDHTQWLLVAEGNSNMREFGQISPAAQ